MIILRLLLVLVIGSLCGCASKTPKPSAESVAASAAIKADFKRVQMGMTRTNVHALLGPPVFSLQQPQPQTIPDRYDGPRNAKLTYIRQESYYPPPPLRSEFKSYMAEGFIIFYAESDTVVHKVLHPELR